MIYEKITIDQAKLREAQADAAKLDRICLGLFLGSIALGVAVVAWANIQMGAY